MWQSPAAAIAVLAMCAGSSAQQASDNITVVNGQIYTPGLAIIDSPQPNTPEGGDYLQIAIDVSGDGRLSTQPPADPNAATGLYNVTLFLTSTATGLNLTISNGTSAGWRNGTDQPTAFGCPTATVDGTSNAGCEPILMQESGSTVKHVNWAWPDCLVGNGVGSNGPCGRAQPSVADCVTGNARGAYNISIHQSFRLNGSAYYTVFDLPIDVTNSVPNTTQRSSSGKRPLCAQLNNVLLPPDQVTLGTTPLPYQPYLGGAVGTQDMGNSTNGKGGLSAGSILEINPQIIIGLLLAVLIAYWLM